MDTLSLHLWGHMTWAKDALRDSYSIRVKANDSPNQGIPITKTNRRCPLDTFWEMVPNVEDTLQDQDQDVDQDQDTWEDQDFQ